LNLSGVAEIATIVGAPFTVAAFIYQVSLKASREGAGRRAEGMAPADSDTTVAGKPVKNVRVAERGSQRKRLDPIRQRIANWTHTMMIGVALSLGLLSAGVVFGLYALLAPSPQLTVTVSCAVVSGQLVPGAIVQITYHINANESFPAGLGAGVYDNAGNDHSTGYGDQPDLMISKGQTSISRPVLLSPKLPAGYYEITGEIWPPNEIGTNGKNTIADRTCGYFTVH
jgi:hypothetical protein